MVQINEKIKSLENLIKANPKNYINYEPTRRDNFRPRHTPFDT